MRTKSTGTWTGTDATTDTLMCRGVMLSKEDDLEVIFTPALDMNIVV